jgi:hypothetical protein
MPSLPAAAMYEVVCLVVITFFSSSPASLQHALGDTQLHSLPEDEYCVGTRLPSRCLANDVC